MTQISSGKLQASPAREIAAVLQDIAGALAEAKTIEGDAKQRRIKLEEELAYLLPGKESGSKTTTAGNMKITITRGLLYKADLGQIEETLREVRSGMKTASTRGLMFPLPIESETTRRLDVKGYEWYREHHPDIHRLLAEHVEVKPKKVSVSVKPIKEGT